jgi:hypothetical protein
MRGKMAQVHEILRQTLDFDPQGDFESFVRQTPKTSRFNYYASKISATV